LFEKTQFSQIMQLHTKTDGRILKVNLSLEFNSSKIFLLIVL